jgi:hypothetical protein
MYIWNTQQDAANEDNIGTYSPAVHGIFVLRMKLIDNKYDVLYAQRTRIFRKNANVQCVFLFKQNISRDTVLGETKLDLLETSREEDDISWRAYFGFQNL